MKSIVLKTLTMAMLVLATATMAQTWDCGETPGTVTATLNDGTLTISGSGAMRNNGSPWSDFNSSITKVVIEEGVTSIGNSAFSACSSLTSVMIPNSVTSIGRWAFIDCKGLRSVTIPNSVTSIGDAAFFRCDNLTNIICLREIPPIAEDNTFVIMYQGSGYLLVPEASINAYRLADGWKNFRYIQAWETRTWDCGVTPGTVTATLNEDWTLTISGIGAMKNDISPWYGFRVFIADAVIGNGVTSVGPSTFAGCYNLTSVTIPNSVTSIGNSAFSDCKGLRSVTIPNSVTSIESYAFSYCGLTSVTIPNSVTSIEDDTFRGCTGLTSVTIPNSVAFIGESAFSGCRSLTSVTIPTSVISIRDGAFSACIGLTNINIDDDNAKYSSVDGVLFNKDKDILHTYPGGKQGAYIIPDSVAFIGESAFSGCRSLTSVTIPNSVSIIGWAAFLGCSGLTSVTIPNSVTYIGNGAFSGCSGLTSVTIPNSVTEIGQTAFSNCNGLTNIISLGVVPPNVDTTYTNGVVFNWVNVASACLYVPQTAINAYRSAEVWKDFGCIQAIDGALNVTFDSQGGSGVSPQYELSGGNVTKPADPVFTGYTFGGWYREAACITPWNFDTDVIASDMTLYAKWTSTISVLTPNRVIPQTKPNEEATVIAPMVILAGEFTAGPNPVSKESGSVNFYRQGKWVANCELRIYDATGNVINKVKIRDSAIGNQARRRVGEWDLADKNGRQVSEGTYLVKGVVKTPDGKSEKVSVIVGVR